MNRTIAIILQILSALNFFFNLILIFVTVFPKYLNFVTFPRIYWQSVNRDCVLQFDGQT